MVIVNRLFTYRKSPNISPTPANANALSVQMSNLVSSNIGTVRPGFLRWQRMATQGRRIIKNSGRRIIIYAGN